MGQRRGTITKVRKFGVIVLMVMALMLAACTSSASPSATRTALPATTVLVATTALRATQTAAHPYVTWEAVTGRSGTLWVLGEYPCSTGTCLAILRS